MTVKAVLIIIPLAMVAMMVYLIVGMTFAKVTEAIMKKLEIDSLIVDILCEEGTPAIWCWPLFAAIFFVGMFFRLPYLLANKLMHPRKKKPEPYKVSEDRLFHPYIREKETDEQEAETTV
jgi:hypothetical protein